MWASRVHSCFPMMISWMKATNLCLNTLATKLGLSSDATWVCQWRWWSSPAPCTPDKSVWSPDDCRNTSKDSPSWSWGGSLQKCYKDYAIKDWKRNISYPYNIHYKLFFTFQKLYRSHRERRHCWSKNPTLLTINSLTSAVKQGEKRYSNNSLSTWTVSRVVLANSQPTATG